MTTEIDTLVSRLRDGYTLTNRGTGWWLESPRKPYQRSDSTQIPDATVDKMEADGLIKCEMPYNSIKAVLCG